MTQQTQDAINPISEATQKSYRKIIAAALNHSRKKRQTDHDEPVSLTLTEVVEDFLDREDLSPATKNTIKAGLMWWVRGRPEYDSPDGTQAMSLLKDMQRKRGRPVTNRPKVIGESDLNLLLEDINRRAIKSTWAGRCAVWVMAGLACGARPNEWLNIEWANSEKSHLKIKTSKVHLGEPAFLRIKSNGDLNENQEETMDASARNQKDPYRFIPIEKDSDREVIDQHLAMIEEVIPKELDREDREDLFFKYHRECRRILERASRKIWNGKKQYSFYTMRKQFSANMKAAFGSTVTAGLMGHSGSDFKVHPQTPCLLGQTACGCTLKSLVLRLKRNADQIHQQIATALGIAKGSVTKFCSLAAAAGLDWSAVQTMSGDRPGAAFVRPSVLAIDLLQTLTNHQPKGASWSASPTLNVIKLGSGSDIGKKPT